MMSFRSVGDPNEPDSSLKDFIPMAIISNLRVDQYCRTTGESAWFKVKTGNFSLSKSHYYVNYLQLYTYI